MQAIDYHILTKERMIAWYDIIFLKPEPTIEMFTVMALGRETLFQQHTIDKLQKSWIGSIRKTSTAREIA